MIKNLETPDPDDPKPQATRASLQLLRILQTCGPEEMLEAITSHIYASIAATRVIVGSVSTASKLVWLIAAEAATTWVKAEEEALKSRRTPQ
jgi:hypothetical protein